MHFVKLHFVPGSHVGAELQLWQEHKVILLCDMLMFTFNLPFSFQFCQALISRDQLSRSSLSFIRVSLLSEGACPLSGRCKRLHVFLGLLTDSFFCSVFLSSACSSSACHPGTDLRSQMATAAVTAISQFSFHQCLKNLSTLRQPIKHNSLFEKSTKFYFHFWICPVFPAVVATCSFALLLLCAVDLCPFSSFYCCVMSQLDPTHVVKPFISLWFAQT